MNRKIMLGRTFFRTYSSSSKSSWSRILKTYRKPILLGATATIGATLAGFAYCEYDTYQIWSDELSPEQFTRYKISQRVSIDPDHYFLELKPVKNQTTNVWKKLNCRRLWSVEIKQPEIMIVRNYTPLPLKLMPSQNSKLEDYALETLDIAHDDFNDGKLLFYIKNYETGEVARWLRNLDIGSIVDIRGPYVEYEIKDTVKTLNFFTAGTGIVSALQLLLNNTSQYSNNLTFYHTSHDFRELGPLYSKLLEVGKLPNVQLLLFDKNHRLRKNLKDVKNVIPCRANNESFNEGFVSLVCGPDSFISSISGPKNDLNQGPINGILKEKGWSNENVYKL